MTLDFVLMVLAGAACGGFINGLAGFGTALFALGWWLQVMPPLQAVPLVLAMSVVSGLQGAVLVRKAIRWRRLAVFLLPALAGIPFGLHLLQDIDSGLLKLVIAGFMLLYGGFFAFRRELPNLTRPTPVVDGAVGFAGGILGAVAGLSGALPTMWISMRSWPKEQSRAVLQPFNIAVLGISAALLALDGAYDRQVLIAIAVALPATLIAAQAGLWTFRRLSDHQFRRLLIGMTLLAGTAILLRELA